MSNMISSALLGLAIFILIITPFILYGVNNKLKKSRKQKKLFLVGEEHHLSFSKTEFSDEFCMGLDTVLHKLVILKFDGKDEFVQVYDLDLIMRVEASRNFIKPSEISPETFVDGLGLVLKPKDKSTPDIHLALYNTEKSLEISTELSILEKWVNLINDNLRN